MIYTELKCKDNKPTLIDIQNHFEGKIVDFHIAGGTIVDGMIDMNFLINDTDMMILQKQNGKIKIINWQNVNFIEER